MNNLQEFTCLTPRTSSMEHGPLTKAQSRGSFRVLPFDSGSRAKKNFPAERNSLRQGAQNAHTKCTWRSLNAYRTLIQNSSGGLVTH